MSGFLAGRMAGSVLARSGHMCRPDRRNMPKVTINTPAPDFELADISGKGVRLSDLRGWNVLLVFNRGFM